MSVTLEVGKWYELNNGEVHKCELGWCDCLDRIAMDGIWYHKNGEVGTCEGDPNHPKAVKREVESPLEELVRLDQEAGLFDEPAPEQAADGTTTISEMNIGLNVAANVTQMEALITCVFAGCWSAAHEVLEQMAMEAE